MMRTSRFSLLCAALLAVAMACSEYNDDPVDPGTPADTTPPGITAVVPIDGYQVEVVFNEALNRPTAQDLDHYLLNGTISGVPASDTTITVVSAVLLPDLKTVSLHTSGGMTGYDCVLAVEGVADAHGNEIIEAVDKPFRGSDEADITAPEIVRRFPAPGATGVAVGFPVRIQFSEPIYTPPGSAAYSPVFELSKSGSPVAVLLSQFDATTWELKPVDLLDYDTEYTVDVAVSDGGNIMTPAQWTFRTTATVDETPPTLVSTAPSHLSVRVPLSANLSATFSEPMDQEYSEVALTPDPGAGTTRWSEDGRTVTFIPESLDTAQQYTFAIYPGDVRDLAGNEIERLYTIVFTTAGALEKGSIAGTLTGDPGTQAADPSGAVVIAGDAPFDPGPFNTLASTVVAPNNTYNVLRLADASYYLIAILDTNHDGHLEPGAGDAVGAYGIEEWPSAEPPDSIAIVNGSKATNRDFPLIDPTSVRGTVTYSGASAGGSFAAYIALDTTAFDTTSAPIATVLTEWPETPTWEMLSIDQGFGDAVYYVRAFLDVNTNGTYDPATDPVGMYGGTSTPTPLNVANGVDFTDIVVPLADPVAARAETTGVAWPAPRHNPAYQLIREIARRGLTAK